MTDRKDSDRELDEAVRQLVADASADAPDPPNSSDFDSADHLGRSSASKPRRLVTASAVGLAIAAAVVLAFVVVDDEPTTTVQPIDTAPSATTTNSVVAPTSSTPETVRVPETVPVPETSVVSTVAPVVAITRPVTSEDVCAPVSARERFTEGITFFARPSTNPVPIQVIADPAAGPVGPFAVVQRYFGDGRTPTGDEVLDIDGTAYWISVNENVNGSVEWDVGDGSFGYVRSRALDRVSLIDILSALSPRAADAAIPGFDYSRPAGGLRLLHESMNTDVDGAVGSSECVVASTGYRYRISAIAGDPIFQYGGVIDRPVPLEVGTIEDTLIVIDGRADPAAPRVGDVINADPSAWIALRVQPTWPEAEEPRTEAIAEGSEVVVALKTLDDSTATSYLTLRLRTEQGVKFLEVDTAQAVLAPDAAFWSTTIDPGNDGISTAHVGGTLGFRIGETAIGEPIEVTINVIDGGEFVLQTTGVILLLPL